MTTILDNISEDDEKLALQNEYMTNIKTVPKPPKPLSLLKNYYRLPVNSNPIMDFKMRLVP